MCGEDSSPLFFYPFTLFMGVLGGDSPLTKIFFWGDSALNNGRNIRPPVWLIIMANARFAAERRMNRIMLDYWHLMPCSAWNEMIGGISDDHAGERIIILI